MHEIMRLGLGRMALAAAGSLFVAMIASGAVRAEVTAGMPAPEFTAQDSNGDRKSLSEYKGKIVVLEWTNHECPWTMKHYATANMQTLQSEAAAQGVVWLSVVSSAPGEQGYVDGAAANRLTVERNAKPTAVLLDPDGRLGRLYGAKATPHMFVIDKSGRLAYDGAIDDKPSANYADVNGARNYVREALAALAEGKQVVAAATRPYGCSVKYSSPKS